MLPSTLGTKGEPLPETSKAWFHVVHFFMGLFWEHKHQTQVRVGSGLLAGSNKCTTSEP